MSRGARRSKRESQVFRIKILIAAAILTFAFLLIFSTNAVRVTGNEHVTGEEVRRMLTQQPGSGNTILLLVYNRFKPIQNENFIDHLTLRLADPHTVVATVHEKQLAGYIAVNGKFWYFDREGEIEACSDHPETSVEEGKRYIPLVTGLTAGSPEIGDFMPAADTDFYERFGNLQTVLDRNRVIPDIVEVDEEYQVTLTYGKIRVELGDLDYLEQKMRTLIDILPETDGLEGTLLMSEYDGSEEGVVFRKKGREVPVVTPESGENSGEDSDTEGAGEEPGEGSERSQTENSGNEPEGSGNEPDDSENVPDDSENGPEGSGNEPDEAERESEDNGVGSGENND